MQLLGETFHLSTVRHQLRCNIVRNVVRRPIVSCLSGEVDGRDGSHHFENGALCHGTSYWRLSSFTHRSCDV